MNTIWVIIIIALIMFGLFIWLGISLLEESKKDWNILYALEKRAKEVETKEEIEIFYKDLQEVKTTNPHIKPRLIYIDGYLRGLYKQFKK